MISSVSLILHSSPRSKTIFKAYTGNEIPLSEATKRILSLLPAPITEEQMDSYLDERFETYRGVPELMEWCEKKDILFMINTTGMQGYFQRVFAKETLAKCARGISPSDDQI